MKAYVVFARFKKWWGILDDLISLVEKIDYSHCAILIENENGNSYVYESLFPEGRVIGLEKWLESYDVKHIVLVDSKFDRFSPKYYRLVKMTESKYSVLQVFTIGLSLLFIPFGNFFNNRLINGNKAKICTELVCRFLQVGYGLVLPKSPDMMSVKDTYNLALKAVQKEVKSEL